MITIKPKELEEKVAKRTKYSEGFGAKKAKMSSVKRVIMLCLLTKVKETHENVRTLLTAIDLCGIPFTFSCDIKLDLMLIGKQQASCTHNCIYCTGKAPWTGCNCGELLTVGALKQFHSQYLERDSEKDTEADFNNCVNANLLQLHFPDEMYVIDCINIPELHILMGIIVKLLDYIKSLFGKEPEDKSRGADFVHQYLTSLNITQKSPGRLEGNQAEKVAQNSGQLLLLAGQLPQEEISERVKKVAPVIEAFNRVKHSCFGERLYGDHVGEIARFCSLYRSLPGITMPPKFHMLESHVVTFLARRHAEGFENHGLAYWGEQCYEAAHHDFKVYWERRKLGHQHENYVAALSDAFLEWNSSHI